VGNSKTFICFPIEKSGSSVAGFGIFCDSQIEPNAEVEAFLKAIGHVLSLHLYRSDVNQVLPATSLKPIKVGGVTKEATSAITDRQLLILRMMSEGRTNLAISERLGYSESTIRQETIRIFAKLGCSSREEATSIFLEKLVTTG
jgi:DNA-binding NarL/FixJ family response regulator